MNCERHNVPAAIVVVVPAAQEVAVIARVIQTIASQEYDGPVAVAIAVNGALDGTAERARSTISQLASKENWRWSVLELPEPSKARAMNVGENAARSALASLGCMDPEITMYIDADIELSSNVFACVAQSLAVKEARLVQPSRCAESHAGIWSRVAGRALCALPWVADDVACGGFFAVNAEGRARWQDFPDLAADDAYVFHRFTHVERVVVQHATATHPMPATLRGLARQQRRWRLARMELARSGVSSARACDAAPKWPLSRRIRAIACSPRVLVAVVVLRVIRIAATFDRTPFRSHRWSVDRVRNDGVSNNHSFSGRKR